MSHSNMMKKQLHSGIMKLNTRKNKEIEIQHLIFPADKIKQLLKTFKSLNDYSISTENGKFCVKWENGEMNFSEIKKAS